MFGEATLALTPRLLATTGVRYSREWKTVANSGRLYTLDAPVTLLAVPYDYSDEISHSAWTPKFGLEWRARAKTLTYLSATRGFKTGGFNITSTERGRGFAPEWAWSYEGGVKTVFAGGRVNVSAFRTDYTNLQVQTAIRPGVIDISNAAEATIQGVELEASARIGRGVEAGGHLSWLDASYDRYVAVGVGGVASDAAGHRLSNTPEWSGRLWLEWGRQTAGVGRISVRLDSRWQSAIFFTPINDAIQRQPAYGLLDVSTAFEFGTHWSLAAFARNITDEGYITGSFSTPPPAIGGRPGSPRHVGIQLRLSR
jgi:iron complex outermembrane receptor protein